MHRKIIEKIYFEKKRKNYYFIIVNKFNPCFANNKEFKSKKSISIKTTGTYRKMKSNKQMVNNVDYLAKKLIILLKDLKRLDSHQNLKASL